MAASLATLPLVNRVQRIGSGGDPARLVDLEHSNG